MVEAGRCPCFGAMTGGAIGAILPVVIVVGEVAGNAVRRDQVMVKGSRFPSSGGMAEAAIGAELSIVLIILFVAGEAIHRRALIDFVDMTCCTISFEMLAF